MKDKVPAAASFATSQPVESLNPNDVLLGRGSGCYLYIGNMRFRDLVDSRKEEYNAEKKHGPKRVIARQVMDHVHFRGGRFLMRDEAIKIGDDIVENGVWYIADESQALEKCKQTLREQRGPPFLTNTTNEAAGGSSPSMVVSSNDSAAFPIPSAPPSQSRKETPAQMNPLSSAGWTFPSNVQSTLLSQAVVDTRLLLAYADAIAFTEFSRALSSASLTANDPNGQASLAVGPPRNRSSPSDPTWAAEAPLSMKRSTNAVSEGEGMEMLLASDAVVSGGHAGEVSKEHECSDGRVVAPNKDSFDVLGKEDGDDDLDVTEFLSSVLALSGRTVFTEQEEIQERTSLTDEERAKILADQFGKYCSIRQAKKPRQDLDSESIAFLVKQMRLEIEKIPDCQKKALMEAQQKCHEEEFDDSRLERFLRCVRMDVQLAAQRFVHYWQKRREVFGPEKYLMRMTLSGALQDDLVALEKGVTVLLPYSDASGRQVIYNDAACHTREGYSSESLFRATWYVFEVASRAIKDVSSRFVFIGSYKNATLWDYDPKVGDNVDFCEANVWPIRVCAVHICCISSLLLKVLKPISYAFMDKESRSRTVFHDQTENELMEVMASYGLTREKLPTKIGGTLEFDQRGWITQRRAIEMEEL